MTAPRLVIFDVDGTMSDSQGHILAAMADAFAAVGAPLPAREVVLSIVGLSLEVAIARLAPEVPEADRDRMVAAYRAGFRDRRIAGGAASSPLFPGIAELIAELSADPATVLGIATGKSMRGAEALLDGHGLRRHFVTLQVADHHPSKPHPSMLLAAMAETGIGPARAVMIGDTSFDMEMARASGMRGISVGWGYHPETELSAASLHVGRVSDLAGAIDSLLAPEAAA
ncbi:MAG: HAD-IA family hydrolase [Pseudooceanicola sp.]